MVHSDHARIIGRDNNSLSGRENGLCTSEGQISYPCAKYFDKWRNQFASQ